MTKFSRIDSTEKFEQVYDAAILKILDVTEKNLNNELSEIEIARAKMDEYKQDKLLSVLLNTEAVNQHKRVDEIEKQLTSLKACREYTVQQVAQKPIFVIGIPREAKYMLSSLLLEIPNFVHDSSLRFLGDFETDGIFTMTDGIFTMVEFLEV